MSRLTLAAAALSALLASCSTDPAPPSTSASAAPIAPVTTVAPISTAPSTTSTPPSTAPSTTTTTLAELRGLRYAIAGEGFSQPVLAVTPPGDDRLFVVERPGTVRILGDGGPEEPPALDLTAAVGDSGIEMGLLGLAFHPGYQENGRVFVYYVGNDANSRLVEMRGDPSTGVIDPASERLLLSFDQAIERHYGGMLQFGPDGYLYASLGEGGAASVNSQDPSTLLSAILRLDVDGGDPYAVPADNPFVAGGGAPEVWAYGLRNPWRFAIDPVDRLLYIADVGHEDWEELNVLPIDEGGHNLGWLRMEGTHCFQRGCDPVAENLTLPVFEYSHDEGCSISGGFVYRGKAIPEVEGHYFFSDWCAGWLRSYRHADGQVVDWTEQVGEIGQVNGFGIDADGEIYVLGWDGVVARIVADRGDGTAES